MVKHDRKDTKTDDFWLIWKRKLKSEFMQFAKNTVNMAHSYWPTLNL